VTLPGEPDDRLAKRALRAEVRARRAARTPEERFAAASSLAVRVGSIPEIAALVEAGEAGEGCVAAYASMAAEPGTDALRSLLALSGVRVLLPVIRDDDGLDWAWDGEDLVTRPGRLPVPEPGGPVVGTGAAALVDQRCRVLLLPATAVDPAGYRLGQGGGFYDRLLSELPSVLAGGPLRVAVVYDDEVLPAVPHEPHDRRIDAVLTPTTYRRW
jgi:5-formyltetrahydrofolate cyclo-ligase